MKDTTVENQQEGVNSEEMDENTAMTTEKEQEGTVKEDALEAKVKELTQQVDELKDKFLRKSAEFENFRKRTIKEKVDTIKLANKDTLSALLPVLDDFDRAKKNAEENDKMEIFNEGVGLIQQKLHSVLKQKGLTAMESTGETFDPDFHEAITEIPAPTEDMKGKVIDTVEKGYALNDKIIRYAKVVVGK